METTFCTKDILLFVAITGVGYAVANKLCDCGSSRLKSED